MTWGEEGYKKLEGVTGDDRDYKGLQKVKRGDRELNGVAGGEKGYKGSEGVTRGYRG